MFRYFMSVFFVIGILIASCSAAESPQEEKTVVKTRGKPVLGVVAINMDDDELKKLNLHGGAKIKKVMEDSEAKRIGLKAGDIIIKFDGSDIAGPEDLHDLIADIEEEKKVDIIVMRDGKEKKFTANLKPGEREPFWVWSDDGEFEFDFDFDEFPHHFMPLYHKGGFLGVETEELSDQLKTYFEVEYGVLIEEVIEESPAEKAGLKAGDVITEIDGRKIEDYRDLVRTVNYYDPGETVEVKYTRKGKSSSVKVQLGERKKMKWHHFKLDELPEKLFFDYGDHFERNLERGMRHLEDNLRDLERNLKRIETNIAII